MYIDTHAHLYSDELSECIDDYMVKAREAGVADIIMPNVDVSSIQPMLEIANAYEQCHPLIGLHPCHVKSDYKEQLKTISQQADDNYLGIGECGIDLYWDKTYVDEQKKAFSYQIDMAIDMDLPIIIHSRDSLDTTISMISKRQNGNLKGIFHCFNGSIDQSKAIRDAGFLMGAGGIITYKNAGMAPVYAAIPLDAIVLETDAPYLSPTPHRGKTNAPHYIPVIAEKLAIIKEVSTEEISQQTAHNARNIFRLN